VPLISTFAAGSSRGFGQFGRTGPGGGPVSSGDSNFRYVSLLLNADSINGATNNTFLDSSQNNTTVTSAGTIAQGSFSPFGNNWSNFFDGDSDRLSITNNAAFQFGTQDYTVEAWVYINVATSFGIIVKCSDDGSWASGWTLALNSGGTGWTSYHTGINTTTGFATNRWIHLAITRSGSTETLWVNGANAASAAAVTLSPTSTLTIGADITATNYEFNGHISNVRVVKGTALYTSAFTPSTTPLTAVSGTSLLTCQSNRFRDNSTNNFTLTPTGDVAVQRFSPFSPTSEYSTSTIGGSLGKFTTNNYLGLPSTNFAFGTASFTVELWLYYRPSESVSSYGAFFDNGSQGVFLSFGTSINNLLFYGTANGDVTGFAHGMRANTWNHLAFVRNGTTMTIYVNGSSIGSWTGITGSSSPSSATATIGTYSLATASYPCGGYIANMRVVNGVAVYTGNFTPPTLPLTTAGATSAACYPSTTNVNTSFSAASTSMLLNGTNSNIVDSSAFSLISTVGQTQVSTAQNKFGGSSVLFDGTGDYLSILNNASSTPWGTEDWTIECWIYPTTVDTNFRTLYTNGFPIQIYMRSGTIELYISSAGGTSTYIVSGLTGPASSITVNIWSHMAVVKNGSNYNVYVNGVSGTTGTTSTAVAYPSATSASIGAAFQFSGVQYEYAGYIDDFRITKGLARYTTNFTPPIAALPTF
jgi:hypothetical protein